MKAYITHGLDQWPSAEAEGIQGFRVDVPQDGPLLDFIAPIVGMPLDTCFILHDIARNEALLDAMRDTGYDTSRALIEPFNEREQGRVTPQVMIDAINILFHDCDARGFQGRLVASGDSDLKSVDFYGQIAPQLPADCIIACHDYPKGTQRLYSAWHGSHEADIELFLEAIGNHQPACSEFGFHMAEEVESHLFHPDVHSRLTEEDVYTRLMEYLRRYARYGFLFAAVYQWGDGDTDNAMGRYGLHHLDLTPKRQLDAMTDWRT